MGKYFFLNENIYLSQFEYILPRNIKFKLEKITDELISDYKIKKFKDINKIMKKTNKGFSKIFIKAHVYYFKFIEILDQSPIKKWTFTNKFSIDIYP